MSKSFSQKSNLNKIQTDGNIKSVGPTHLQGLTIRQLSRIQRTCILYVCVLLVVIVLTVSKRKEFTCK